MIVRLVSIVPSLLLLQVSAKLRKEEIQNTMQTKSAMTQRSYAIALFVCMVLFAFIIRNRLARFLVVSDFTHLLSTCRHWSLSRRRWCHEWARLRGRDRKSTRLNSSHVSISYA